MADLNAIPGLKDRINITRMRIGALRVAEAFWPFFLFAGAFVIIALAGLFDNLEPAMGAIAALVTLAGGAWLAWRGRKALHWPTQEDAEIALDRGSEMRPIASLLDRPARPTTPGQALWEAHEIRLGKAAMRLRPPALTKEWRALDPARLRYGIPALAFVLALIAGSDAGARLQRALSPDYGALLGAGDLRIDAWVTPPDYSGRAPVFLTAETGEIRVPAGSEVTLRAQARSAPALIARSDDARSQARFEATPDGAYEIKATVTADTTFSVRWWGERAAWRILASPDSSPIARFIETPKLGENDRTVFEWDVSDDYGVERLELDLRLVEPHPAAPDATDRIAISMREVAPKEATDAAELDLTRHRWAGLKVEARLVATDGAGQEGESAAHVFVLPEKLLLQPLAKSIQEIRVTVLREPRDYGEIAPNPWAVQQDAYNSDPLNRLAAAPPDVQRAALMLDAVTYEGPRFFKDYSIWLALRTSRGVLGAAPDKAEANTVDSVLWAAALKAEYGSSADALAALLAAKRALENALRDGASEEEIARLTDAFRRAAENYVQAKIAEAVANGLPPGEQPGLDEALQGGGGSGFGAQDLEDMLSALEDLSQTGATEQARQLLSDITNLLENLQFQQGGGQGGGEGFPMPGQQGEQGEDTPDDERELSDAIEGLSDLLREQRELNDDTLEGGRRDFGEAPQPGLDGESLAQRQDALRELLEQLQESGALSPQPGGEDGEDGEAGGGGEEGEDEGRAFGGIDPQTLEAIERLQERASRSLRRGNQRAAEDAQENATGLLRELVGDLADELDALQEARDNNGAPDGATDPFGNPLGGADDTDSIDVPDEAERQRAKDILEELRRRFGDTEDETEREYLRRLLDRF